MPDATFILQVLSGVIALSGVATCIYALRTSGRDRPEDEVAVRHLLDTAPYDGLERVLTK